MAWRSHGTSNLSLIGKLVENTIIQNPLVKAAMSLIDRGHFVHNPNDAYFDNPVPIGFGATISAPHMHAYVLELLADKLVPGAKVLDVGSGSGYLLATFGQMIFSSYSSVVGGTITNLSHPNTGTIASSSANNPSGVSSTSVSVNSTTASPSSSSSSGSDSNGNSSSNPTTALSLIDSGKVYGVEHIPQLVTWSIDNLKKNTQTKQWLEEEKISVSVGDGRYGLPDTGPYDVIHVGAAAAQIPSELIDQLANNGKLVLPVGPNGGDQVLVMITKNNEGKVRQEVLMGVRYVPLTSREYQESHS